jgi:hypothetical protein
LPIHPFIPCLPYRTSGLAVTTVTLKKFRMFSFPSPADFPEQLSQFELRALAFADLIDRISNEEGLSLVSSPPPPTELPSYSTVRCICGQHENRGELIQCSDCDCYLHLECVDHSLRQNPHFRCPFCSLQIDGVDPFRELMRWIEMITGELTALQTAVTEAGAIESQIYDSGPRQRVLPLRSSLAKAIQDINQQIANLKTH